MPADRDKATADFKRVMTLILTFGIVFTAGALAYLGATGELYLHMVVAVIGGVFISVLLGCGLFAAAFFSDKSGHDRNVTDATRGN
jgi:fumarate reductase subunit D